MSKFDGILKAAKEREDSDLESAASEETLTAPTPKKQGRPKGKRSSPDYEQVTDYIKK